MSNTRPPGRCADDVWWVWCRLAKKFPEKETFDYSERQIRGAWREVLAERRHWDEWVTHVRETTLKGMTSSAFVASVVPSGEPDIKFAVELGLAIMLGKPVVAIATPGQRIPPGLRKVADAVIECDLDTADGAAHAASEIKKFMATLDDAR